MNTKMREYRSIYTRSIPPTFGLPPSFHPFGGSPAIIPTASKNIAFRVVHIECLTATDFILLVEVVEGALATSDHNITQNRPVLVDSCYAINDEVAISTLKKTL